MSRFKETIKSNLKEYTMGIALVVIIVLFQIITNSVLLRPLNVTNLILQNSYVLILAIGMLLCILTGGNIDLSVGSVVAFIGALSGVLIVNNNMGVLPAILICLMVGLLIGIWQGFWIAYVRIPAFITTLAGMLMFRGLTLVILGGRTIGPFPESFQFLSSGFIPDILGGDSLHLLTIAIGVILSIAYVVNEIMKLRKKRSYGFEVPSTIMFVVKLIFIVALINAIFVILALYKGISTIMLILLALIFIYTFITQKTVLGRHIYALGGNEKAAKLSGIKTRRVLFLVYVNIALLASFAGIVIAGRLNAATPKAGTGFELDAVAACFIGGASTTGGAGTVFGTIVGALIMGVLNNAMSILGISVDWQQAIKGLVLLVAVAFDIITKARSNN
jgi:putative multiple sugar transport system permease protein